ncbi:DUF523 and DUF1722 domain-containing protein [Methanolobus sp. ZRKC3]|uniref:YbgA family protein n=1 Tax=Methanolobus sp. ZRKC3 TaxID=3125786 RepID=UPI003247A553
METFPMSQFPRPIIVISKCLGFAACRYDAQMVESPFVESMKPFVEFIDVCPECEIGLGLPRKPIRIVLDGEKRLVQPATGRDLTDNMKDFAESYLEELDDFDGFILKSKSPSCGLGTTKAFSDDKAHKFMHSHENGFFADAVISGYSHLPIVDELGIADPLLRDHFLARIFALASFREAASLRTTQGLLDYHTRNKLLFMAYNQDLMRIMGDVVANGEGCKVDEVYEHYLPMLVELLSKPADSGSVVNAMMHAFGYFSRKLSARDKFLFLNKLQAYREDNSAIFELRKILISRAQEFELEYLCAQTFFSPYPPELSDSL